MNNRNPATGFPTGLPATLLLLFLFLLFVPVRELRAAEITVRAELNTREFSPDQAALLTVTVEGSQEAEVEPPTGQGLHFSYQGRSTRFQWINGRSSSAIHFTYWVQADQVGEYTIDPVKVKIDGRTYESNPIRCRVTAGTTGPPAGNSGGRQPGQSANPTPDTWERLAVLQILPEKERAYTGELIPFTLRLCLRKGTRFRLRHAPGIEAEHLTLEELDKQPLESEEIIDGQACDGLTWHGMLTGVKAGTFDLTANLELIVLIRTAKPSSRGPWSDPLFNDPFFDRFLGSYIEKKLSLKSRPQAITIQDTPVEGRPADYRGAVGTFSLAVSASPTSLRLGDPVTLKMIVSGTGNFDRVHAPVLADTVGWKTYPPDSRSASQEHARGKKTFEQALVPVSADVSAIPPARFSYFDPEAKEYVTLTSDPIPVSLELQASGQDEPADHRDDSRTAAAVPGLAPRHGEMGSLVPAILPLYRKTWFQIVAGLALVLACAASLLWVRQQLRQRHPDRVARKALQKKHAKLLRELDQAVDAADADRFFHLLRQTIRSHLAVHWQREEAAITLADLEEGLGSQAILTRLFARAEHGIYTHCSIKQPEMRQILEELRSELDQQA